MKRGLVLLTVPNNTTLDSPAEKDTHREKKRKRGVKLCTQTPELQKHLMLKYELAENQ